MAVKAQVSLFPGTDPAFGRSQQQADTSNPHKKWFVTKSAGISTGFIAYKGGSTNFLSVPLALQVNRQLTNNIFAFGGVSVVPSLLRSNGAFYQPAVHRNSSFMQTNTNNFSAYSDARIGLMYTNNQRTFSISGSIGVSRSSYNGYSPFYAPATFPMMGNMQQ